MEHLYYNIFMEDKSDLKGRRRFLKTLGALGLGAVFTRLGLMNQGNLIFTDKEVSATLNAFPQSVAATSEARSPVELKTEMNRIPESIQQSSFIIYPVYSVNPQDVGGNGTATIIGCDQEKGVIYGITAKHVFLPPEGKRLEALFLKQPHTGEQIYNKRFSFLSSGNDETGYTVFAIFDKDKSKIKGLGWDKIRVDYVPKQNEQLYALPFPSVDERGAQPFPINFMALRGEPYDKFTKKTGLYVTDAVISGGASGAGIVNQKGEYIGLFAMLGVSGGWITPINEEFHEMKRSLMYSLLR